MVVVKTEKAHLKRDINIIADTHTCAPIEINLPIDNAIVADRDIAAIVITRKKKPHAKVRISTDADPKNSPIIKTPKYFCGDF